MWLDVLATQGAARLPDYYNHHAEEPAQSEANDPFMEGIMPASITREEVQRLMRDEAAQLVEVLPGQEYQDEHIQGASNLPLKRLNQETVGLLDKARPVIVY